MGKLAQQLGGQSQVKVYKKGGMVHEDEAADKKLIKAEMKKAKKSGEYKNMPFKKGGKA